MSNIQFLDGSNDMSFVIALTYRQTKGLPITLLRGVCNILFGVKAHQVETFETQRKQWNHSLNMPTRRLSFDVGRRISDVTNPTT